MATMKDTTMQHVTDVTIVPEATAEFIAGLLERIEQLESDLATAEQDSRQKQARIDRLEQALKAMTTAPKTEGAMMSDRELLELAAKAAGYKVYNGGKLFRIWKDSNVEWVDWRPLKDDGDALRLAIKLEMDVSFGLGGAVIEQSHGKKIRELDDKDPYAATRLAIVRAAAEIGRSVK